MPAPANDHWSNTGSSVRFWKIDAVGFAPMSLVLVLKSWPLFFCGIVFLVIFSVLEYKGFTLPNFKRRVRLKISGTRKPLRRPGW